MAISPFAARIGKEALEIVSKAQSGRRKTTPGAMPTASDMVILDMIMPKPFNMRQLSRKIRDILRKR